MAEEDDISSPEITIIAERHVPADALSTAVHAARILDECIGQLLTLRNLLSQDVPRPVVVSSNSRIKDADLDATVSAIIASAASATTKEVLADGTDVSDTITGILDKDSRVAEKQPSAAPPSPTRSQASVPRRKEVRESLGMGREAIERYVGERPDYVMAKQLIIQLLCESREGEVTGKRIRLSMNLARRCLGTVYGPEETRKAVNVAFLLMWYWWERPEGGFVPPEARPFVKLINKIKFAFNAFRKDVSEFFQEVFSHDRSGDVIDFRDFCQLTGLKISDSSS